MTPGMSAACREWNCMGKGEEREWVGVVEMDDVTEATPVTRLQRLTLDI